MFEQAVLRPAPVRGWAVTLAFAGEVLLVGCALAAPLIWPQLLPKAETLTSIVAPAPPASDIQKAPAPRVHPARPWRPEGATVYQPATVLLTVASLDEPPAPRLGAEGGVDTRDMGRAMAEVFRPILTIAPPRRAPEPAAPAVVKPAPAPPRAIRVSSSVEAARLVHRVDPVYPPIARQMRIAGTVELTGVIGTDGRIRELHVSSGHPFLVKAALEAVQQWVYQPTHLSGEPVEVITTISVVFRLN